MLTVELNLVKFHSGTGMRILRSTRTCSAIELLVDAYLKDKNAD